MTTLALDGDLHLGDGSEEATLADADVSLIKVWDVVVAVDFVDTDHAALFDHDWGSSWSFLSWLEEETQGLVLGKEVSVVADDLSYAQDGDHVAIVSAHVSMVCGGFVLKALVALRNGQSIHISSKSNDVARTSSVLRPCSLKVHNKTSNGAVLDFLWLDSIAKKLLSQKLGSLELLESVLWYGM